MTIRTRKLFGAVALIVLVTVWSLVAMAVAPIVLTSDSRLAEFAFYAVAGVGWVLPAMPLVSWMQRPDAPRS